MEQSPSATLAATITKAASQQTYYTIRWLVDRALVADAYRAYAYFRWVDDTIDQGTLDGPARAAFVARQTALLNSATGGARPHNPTPEERLLLELLEHEPAPTSGLHLYLRHMLAVMAFDAERRGRLISQAELTEYTRWLATAVTEALHYFIGHNCASPHCEARYLAVTAAHITHMLRDTGDDVAAGYYNCPREYLEAQALTPRQVDSAAYRAWVASRVQLARGYFQAGRDYLAQVENPRCRLAGFAYIARFDGVLEAIEREGYRLRPAYPERKRPGAVLRMLWSAGGSAFGPRLPRPTARDLEAVAR